MNIKHISARQIKQTFFLRHTPTITTPAHLILTPDEVNFNARMSGVRIAVEQLFGLVLNKWAYNASKY
ncbi:hypothetical protein V1517DRAFT_334176 [Lipomyces orientalis]|uniref:Uncharacterized protein n=1 Tax=Lipomyces orientalis TaxID=1233043 RepID=A0ACC3TDI4_9ASCO